MQKVYDNVTIKTGLFTNVVSFLKKIHIISWLNDDRQLFKLNFCLTQGCSNWAPVFVMWFYKQKFYHLTQKKTLTLAINFHLENHWLGQIHLQKKYLLLKINRMSNTYMSHKWVSLSFVIFGGIECTCNVYWKVLTNHFRCHNG